MQSLSFLANLLLSVTIGTMVVALIAYLAYKLRENRRPSFGDPPLPDEEEGPVFLQLYVPGPDLAQFSNGEQTGSD